MQILGTDMSAKMWEVFNVVGQVMGLITEGQYVPIDKLSETEKALLLLPQIYFHFVVFSLLSCLISYDQPFPLG